MKSLLFLIIAIQLADIALHAMTDQLEPLRVIANIVISLAVLIPLFLRHASGIISAAVGLLLYLILNMLFVLTNGISVDGSLRIGLILFVLATTTATVWLCYVLQKAGIAKKPY